MAINLNNLFNSLSKNSKTSDFQDLDHIDGLSVSSNMCEFIFRSKEMILVMFYFRKGAASCLCLYSIKINFRKYKMEFKN